MSKRRNQDPLITELQSTLVPGQFFRSDEVSELVDDLERLHEKLGAMAKAGEAVRAVQLYELLLAGVYAKIEEADDECYLAMLFHRLFAGWIRARQAAGRPAEETVSQILNWMKNDNYGFCYDIEQEVVKALDRKGRQIFIGHFQTLVQKGSPGSAGGSAKAIFEPENNIRLPAMSLKQIYESRKDAPAYAALCDQLGFSPRDCERLAKMEIAKKHWPKALEWVEKGIALGPGRDWRNEEAHSLKELKPEILFHLGRKQDALDHAWSEFQAHPCEFAYEDLMQFVPGGEKKAWHERMLAAAEGAGLGEFISLCVKTKEWDRLARRVQAAKPSELEALSHYCTEPAAKGLAKKDGMAAAKLYRALGSRILNAGKSKYYDAALAHFRQVRNLHLAAGQNSHWAELVDVVRTAHSRKSGFLPAFEKLVSGASDHSPSFAEQGLARWKRLTS